jgi:hypothetical protein
MNTALIEAAECAHAALCTEQAIRRRKAAAQECAVPWIGVGKQTPTRREAILDAVEDVLLSACWRASDETPMDFMLGPRLRRSVHARRDGAGQSGEPRPRLCHPSAGAARRLRRRRRAGYARPDGGWRAGRYAVLQGGLDAQRPLRAVLPLLRPEHRLVILQYAHGDEVTWREAALRAGLPAEAGERARRRIKRLGRELQRRRQLG